MKKNPFEIFEIPASLDIDRLDQRFRHLQLKFHPDLFKDKVQKEKAKEQSEAINEAYMCLRDQYCLAKSLMSTLKLSTDFQVDEVFLEEVFEDTLDLEDLWLKFYKAWQNKHYDNMPKFFAEWSFLYKKKKTY
jgi:hypothetical protein